ncbi:MAG: Fe-S cluster assembly protein SufB, partial [Mesotoga sp.]|nr:Fe-S cluster assembly protein SufB [Mesotoga sp.]
MREKVFLDSSRFDFLSNTKYRFMSERGFGESQVIDISKRKNEPEWMLKKRLQSFKAFSLSSKPGFGVSTESLDLSRII